MGNPATINPRIVEALYCEALVLCDELRAVFGPVPATSSLPGPEAVDRAAFSAEGLRATTRMMHAIAWLLNHRAYFTGQITDRQLRRYGPLSPALRRSDETQTVHLDPATAKLIEITRRFYDRLLRLDQTWRLTSPVATGAIQRLRERVGARLAG